jgi:hypothetical protein
VGLKPHAPSEFALSREGVVRSWRLDGFSEFALLREGVVPWGLDGFSEFALSREGVVQSWRLDGFSEFALLREGVVRWGWSGGFVVLEGGADLVDVGAVDAEGFF